MRHCVANFSEPTVLPRDVHEILERHDAERKTIEERISQAVADDAKKPAVERWRAIIREREREDDQ